MNTEETAVPYERGIGCFQAVPGRWIVPGPCTEVRFLLCCPSFVDRSKLNQGYLKNSNNPCQGQNNVVFVALGAGKKSPESCQR